ncbi:MAG: hypothetical protein ACFB10_17905 [Salibacteraceae bacterium]
MSATPPLISVVTPCYNVAEFISETISFAFAKKRPKLGSSEEYELMLRILQQFEKVVFDAIRIACAMNVQLAREPLNEHLPKGYQPVPSAETSGFYLKLYRLLGRQELKSSEN